MAIYSCNFSNVSRARGSSAVGSAAYITCRKMIDERTGKECNFGNKSGFVLSETLLPEGAPETFLDPEIMFNSIEKRESAVNAKTAKKVIVALPREMDLYTQRSAINAFIKQNFTNKGYAATYAIHDKGDGNPHAHIIIPTRKIEKDGTWAQTKERKIYALDENGNRIPRLDIDGNQKLGKRNEKLWKMIKIQYNEIETKTFLKAARESWARECNQYLDQEHHIDHRSFADQGIERIPMIHEGYAAREIEARGEISERVQRNLNIRQKNKIIERLKSGLRDIQDQIAEILGMQKREKDERISKERQKEEKERLEKSNFEIIKNIAKKEIQRSYWDRYQNRVIIPFSHDERKAELIEKRGNLYYAKVINGIPLTKEYEEIGYELKELDKIEKKAYRQLAITIDGLNKGYDGDVLYDYVRERQESEERQIPLESTEREYDRDDDEWER